MQRESISLKFIMVIKQGGNMQDLLSIKELRKMEGLDRQVHQTLENIVKGIRKGDTPLMTLAQSNQGEV